MVAYVMDPVSLTDAAKSRLLWSLAAIQFCIVVDFMVLSPMGPILIDQLHIDPKQLGYLVSAYTFSAAIVGLLSALIIDRFDRRSALVFCLVGLALTEVACALSPNFEILLLCRMACGGCAGVIGALLNTIIGDTIEPQSRGKALGQVMSAFAFASVLGVPIGLYFASAFGWHAPFLVVLVCLVLAILSALKCVPQLRGHLTANLQASTKPSLMGPIKQVLSISAHRRAYVLMALVTGSSFLVIPYISVYTVTNVHLPVDKLTFVYLIGGAAALVASRFIGQWTYKLGVQKMFRYLNFASVVSITLTTNLVPVPIAVVLLVSTLFFVVVPTRMVPSMTLVNAAAVPQLRGTFMSLNSALQSTVQGLAAFLAALIIGRDSQNEMVRYGWVGALAVVLCLVAVLWAKKMQVSPVQTNSSTQQSA
jgi:predicted MFS family arabinose efflux permease